MVSVGGISFINVFRDNIKLKIFILIVGILFLVSCAETPKCNYIGDSSLEANAGCLVVHENKLLIVEDNKGRMSLPGGSKNSDEVAQCTAEREVWEETGVEVKAVKRIITFNNGFQLFECDISGKQVLDGSTRPWRFEIDEIHWFGLSQFVNRNWRYPEQLELMKEHLKNYNTDD